MALLALLILHLSALSVLSSRVSAEDRSFDFEYIRGLLQRRLFKLAEAQCQRSAAASPRRVGNTDDSEGVATPPPAVETKFFGIETNGNSFVFVVDRSLSMTHCGRLEAVKAELVSALRNLKKTERFQIIFFNSRTETLNPSDTMLFADDAAKKRAKKHLIRDIEPDGPTDAFDQALRKAIHYGPDVIYFVTDAEGIALSYVETALLTRNNETAAVHTVKLGEGAIERVPWMLRLSRDNGGQYRYVDARRYTIPR